ncbi:MAG TPA: class E sortase [Candidatus Saccharimonadales bacterium]|nr:class E sortase [Candidatus Saccharimonadales bacterium]
MAQDPLSLDPQQPPSNWPAQAPDAQTAADLIRQKVEAAYGHEPDTKQEIAEVEAEPASQRSRHQQFMYDLSTSGKDLAAIQTEWHNYYQGLSDQEKHQVWREFYDSQSAALHRPLPKPTQTQAEHAHQVMQTGRYKPERAKPKPLHKARSKEEIQEAVRDKVSAGGKLQAKHHLQSLLFGLGMGLIVVVIFLFGFFNEILIAPFIQPSRTQAATPLITSPDGVAPTSTPEVIIPKINVEIPVNYSETSTNEAVIENALEDGVVHYPTTALPGQKGNTAFFGHSSNNIFNPGHYKFAFVLLHTLVNGDTFYLTYNNKVYVYKVISHTIVEPSDVGVLDPVPGQTATATLITCDPPGTSLHRLVVVGQQISPDPSGNSQPTVPAATTPTKTTFLPGNGPTLWGRYISTGTGKVVTIIVLIVGLFFTVRWITAPSRSMKLR